MSLRHTLARYALCTMIAVLAVGTATAADRKTTNTLLGAGLGAAAGALLSQGDPLTTIGSAAAGGVLGHVLTDDRKRHNNSHRRYHKGPKHHYGSKHHYAPPHRHASKRYGHHHKKHPVHRKHHRHHR